MIGGEVRHCGGNEAGCYEKQPCCGSQRLKRLRAFDKIAIPGRADR